MNTHHVKEIVRVVCENEPASVWGLHRLVHGAGEDLRAALRLALQMGWVAYNEDMDLVRGSKIEEIQVALGDSAPSSSPNGGGLDASTGHPTPAPGFPQLSLPFPTDPPTSGSHPVAQTESRTHALSCAIRTEVESLLHLEDALNKYLQAATRHGGDKVHRGAHALLRITSLARREFAESGKWLLGIPQGSTDG